jgi:hypothetical protein
MPLCRRHDGAPGRAHIPVLPWVLPVAKISVSLDDSLLDEIRASAQQGNVSGWLADAAQRKLRADALNAYADEVEVATGPLTDQELAHARAWLSSVTQRS